MSKFYQKSAHFLRSYFGIEFRGDFHFLFSWVLGCFVSFSVMTWVKRPSWWEPPDATPGARAGEAAAALVTRS